MSIGGELTIESSNPQIVKIQDINVLYELCPNGRRIYSCNINALKAGKATITVKTKDGKKTAKCEVTVK